MSNTAVYLNADAKSKLKRIGMHHNVSQSKAIQIMILKLDEDYLKEMVGKYKDEV